MADTQTFKQQSFTTEVDSGDGYRRLSRLAIWSIPLGFASALALISPLLWFVPVVAVVFALGGLWAISRADDTTGRRLALVGLATAVLFGTWGMSWTISRHVRLNRHAREYASEWFVMMQNQEYMKAHQLTRDYFNRVPAGKPLGEHYVAREPVDHAAVDHDHDHESTAMPPGMDPDMEQSPLEELHDFKTYGVPKLLVESQGKFQFEFVKNVSVVRDGETGTKVNQLFRLTFSDDHDPRHMEINVEMKRTVEKQRAYWQVGRLGERKEL